MSESLALFAMLFLGSSPATNAVDTDEAAFVGTRGGARIYDFEDDLIEGEVLRAEGVNLASRGSPHHASLLEIRTNFIPELTRMTLDM